MTKSNDHKHPAGSVSGSIRRAVEQYLQTYPATARIDYYRKAAASRLESVQDECSAITLRSILTNADIALEAIQAGDVDRFAQAFERVIRATVETNLPAMESAARRKMGSKGGKASRRPVGALRRILMEICDEIGSAENTDVFGYWRTYASRDDADNDAGDGTCWFKHQLWAEPTADYSLPAQYGSYRERGPFRLIDERYPSDAEPSDTEHVYYYVVGDDTRSVDATTIRKKLNLIRKSR